MIYKKFQDKALSALGLGCMRLPMNGIRRLRRSSSCVG